MGAHAIAVAAVSACSGGCWSSLALNAHRQSQSVRKISGWAAIIAVPTLIAGVYGMNFNTLPGANSSLGFPVCVAAMLVVAWVVRLALKHARWM